MTSDHEYAMLPPKQQYSTDHNIWQEVPVRNKRSLVGGNNTYTFCDTTKKSKPCESTFTVKTTNSYEPLANSNNLDDIETCPPEHVKEFNVPKPPPIFVPDISNVRNMVTAIESVIKKDEYVYRIMNHNNVKISPSTIEGYRKLVQKLTEQKVNFHTYQLKQEKAYRVVLKNMHFSTDPDDIKMAIEELGYNVRNVTNVKHFKTKNPLSLFFIDLEPSHNNKGIFEIQYLLNAKITFEPPHKKTDIAQCKKCQSYGHTKSYCWHPYRCVKCGQSHDTKTCTKPQTEPPRCALCDGSHPANYKGCNVYRELKHKTFPPLRRPSEFRPSSSSNLHVNKESINETTSNSQTQDFNKTRTLNYARATSKTVTEASDHANLVTTVQNFFDKFEKIMLQQSQQISSLMNLLSTVISKLK